MKNGITKRLGAVLLTALMLLAVCPLSGLAAEEPEVTAEPETTEEPAATDEPAATEEPTVTEEPAATEEPEATEEPAATEEPEATEEPAATEEPTATEEPAATPLPAAWVTIGDEETGYASIEAAFAAANAAGTAEITYEDDPVAADALTVAAGSDITINAPYAILTVPQGIEVEGKLTLARGSGVAGPVAVYGGDLVLEERAGIANEGDAVVLYSGSVTAGDNAEIGSISGDGISVLGFEPCQVTLNYADVTGGEYGVYAINEGSVVTTNHCYILGGEAAVCLWFGADASIVSGTLESDGTALMVEGASAFIDGANIYGGTGISVEDETELASIPASLSVEYAQVTGFTGPALQVEGDCTVALSGGTYEGEPNAIQCGEGHTLNSLLAGGCGWFDENGAPLAPAADAASLEGPVTVHSTAPVAEVTANGTAAQYDSIEGAWAAAAKAGSATLTLLADVTARQNLALETGAAVTFQGGGYTLTAVDGIDLGDGSSDPEHSSNMLTVAGGVINGSIILDGGSLVIDGGTVTSSGNTVVNYCGDVTVNSGAVRSDGYSALVLFALNSDDQITVNGGDIAGAMNGILAYGKVTVNGGVITGGENGVDNSHGSVTVSGGAITGGENGICVDGTQRTPATLTVSGGTVDGTELGLRIEENCTVTLSGGVFRGGVNAVECIQTDVLGNPVDQPLSVNSLLAAGYGWFDEAGTPIAAAADQKTLAGPAKVLALTVPTAAPTAAPTATPAPTSTSAPASSSAPTAPKTGDGTAVLPWALLLLGCGAALAAMALRRRMGRR